MAGIQPGYAALAVLIGTLPMFFRAERWRILLQAETPVAFWASFWAVAAGYFGNNFLPARGGEVLRSCLVRSQSSLTMSYVLATAISERVADAVALVLAGAGTMLIMAPLPRSRLPEWMNAAKWSFASIGVSGALLLAFLPLVEQRLRPLLERAPRLRHLVEQALLGVSSFHNWQRLVRFSALTLVIWALDAVATATLAHSMAIPMSLASAILLIMALSLSSAIPSTPGYVGVYQFVAVTVLKPFGISASAALAFILVTQALSYVQTSILGLIGLNRYAVNWPTFLRFQRPIQIQN